MMVFAMLMVLGGFLGIILEYGWPGFFACAGLLGLLYLIGMAGNRKD